MEETETSEADDLLGTIDHSGPPTEPGVRLLLGDSEITEISGDEMEIEIENGTDIPIPGTGVGIEHRPDRASTLPVLLDPFR